MNKYRKSNHKILAFTLSAAMLLGVAAGPALEAKAKKPKLSAVKVSVVKGGKKKVTVKNAKSVKWTVDKKGKKVISLSGKSKKGATIKGKAVGKAKITVKMKYAEKKVLKKTIKVTVKQDTSPATQKPEISVGPPVCRPPATLSPSTKPTQQPVVPTPEPTIETKWVSTWGTAEEKCDITFGAMPQLDLKGSTVRQIIRVTTSGDKIRFRLSNQYGNSPVTVKSMHIAKQVDPKKSEIDVATDTVVTVDGKEEFSIPTGEVIVTDGVDFSVNALENIAISCYFGDTPEENITGHRGARATTYQVEGNQVSEKSYAEPETTTSWFFLADCSVLSPMDSRAVVCFGDSITDGYGTDASYLGREPDSYTRWGDYFANRLQENEKTKHVSVLNEGIGSNSILGSYPTDSGRDRFQRDLLEHDGVEYCIILFGVNDLDKLQDTKKYDQLLPEYQKMVKLCKENDIKVYLAPILPFGTSSYYSEASEEVRTMINNWMRSADSQADGIIDFESAVADPDNPINILEDYTHEDGLHPYDGYDVMADAIDLTMFEK